MRVTIHQPEHLPWLGLFDKVRQADVFVVLDHVQYRHRYFHNRNRVLSANGPIWLTVPVLMAGRFRQSICDVEINNAARWQRKNWETIRRLYSRTPYYSQSIDQLDDIYNAEWSLLVDMNLSLMSYLFEQFEMNVRMVRSSTLGCTQQKSDLILEICQKLDAEVYISGISGKDYLKLEDFASNNIEVVFQQFYHPEYPQRWPPFHPCMSSIDLLFNCGRGNAELFTRSDVPRLDYLFD